MNIVANCFLLLIVFISFIGCSHKNVSLSDSRVGEFQDPNSSSITLPSCNISKEKSEQKYSVVMLDGFPEISSGLFIRIIEGLLNGGLYKLDGRNMVYDIDDQKTVYANLLLKDDKDDPVFAFSNGEVSKIIDTKSAHGLNVDMNTIKIESWTARDEIDRPKGDYYLLAPRVYSYRKSDSEEQYLITLPQNKAHTFFYNKDKNQWMRMLLIELSIVPSIEIIVTRKLSSKQTENNWDIRLCEEVI